MYVYGQCMFVFLGAWVYMSMCVCQLRNVFMAMRDWCCSLFYFSDRGILRIGNGLHGYSDHGAWCFSSWERYWLSLDEVGWMDSTALYAHCLRSVYCIVYLSVDLFTIALPVSSSLPCLWSSLRFSSCMLAWAWSWLFSILTVFNHSFSKKNWSQTARPLLSGRECPGL